MDQSVLKEKRLQTLEIAPKLFLEKIIFSSIFKGAGSFLAWKTVSILVVLIFAYLTNHPKNVYLLGAEPLKSENVTSMFFVYVQMSDG